MKLKEFFYFILLLINEVTSARLKDLEGLEKTFQLFENKCFINTIVVGFRANFVLHDTPIQHTTIGTTIPLNRWTKKMINPRNASLWPSWRMKYCQCVLNTIVMSPKNKWKKWRLLIFLFSIFFETPNAPSFYSNDIAGENYSVYGLKSPNYFLLIGIKPHNPADG